MDTVRAVARSMHLWDLPIHSEPSYHRGEQIIDLFTAHDLVPSLSEPFVVLIRALDKLALIIGMAFLEEACSHPYY